MLVSHKHIHLTCSMDSKVCKWEKRTYR